MDNGEHRRHRFHARDPWRAFHEAVHQQISTADVLDESNRIGSHARGPQRSQRRELGAGKLREQRVHGLGDEVLEHERTDAGSRQ